jgi:hypothetical protein
MSKRQAFRNRASIYRRDRYGAAAAGERGKRYTGTAGNLGHRPPSPREARGECGRRKAIGAEGGGVAGATSVSN